MATRMIASAIFCALFFGVMGAAPRAQVQSQAPSASGKPDVVVTGEVASGNSFERDIGEGLIFRLVPTPAGFGKGWDIEIAPKENVAGGYAEYSAMVTPPYHFYNQRYLNGSYGVTAREAVAISPRKFQFVESAEDSQAALAIVNSAAYTVDWESHKDSIAADAAKIHLGAGELAILDSRITAGKNNEDLGSIDWVKFEVRLWFHPGVTLRDVIFPDYSASR
jgi:hypothetical protein